MLTWNILSSVFTLKPLFLTVSCTILVSFPPECLEDMMTGYPPRHAA
jgi:hypothetical protein